MTFPTDEYVLSTDASTVSLSETTEGVTVDADGSVEVTWDNVPVVDAEDVGSEHTAFFDTDSFYKLRTTVARPIAQPYVVDGERYTFAKTAGELREAAWSFDNQPLTLGHPNSKIVKHADDVRGFWNETTYLDDENELNSSLFLPTSDEEAREYVAEHGDVSVGFFNRLKPATDRADIDAFQVEMLGNHIAAVRRGRCPSDAGCGFNADSDDHGQHGHVIVPEDGDELAENLGCGVPRLDEDENVTYEDLTSIINMSDSQDGGCDCGGNGGAVDFDVDDLTVDTLRTRHETLDEQISEYEETTEAADELQSDLETVEETVDEYVDTDDPTEAVETLTDELEELREFRQEKREERKSGMVDDLSETTEYSEEELTEMDLDELETIEEVAEKAGASVSSPDATGDGGEDDTSSELDEDALYDPQF